VRPTKLALLRAGQGTCGAHARIEGENDALLSDPSRGAAGAEAQGKACAGSLMGKAVPRTYAQSQTARRHEPPSDGPPSVAECSAAAHM
jgi:hypothetical protein